MYQFSIFKTNNTFLIAKVEVFYLKEHFVACLMGIIIILVLAALRVVYAMSMSIANMFSEIETARHDRNNTDRLTASDIVNKTE